MREAGVLRAGPLAAAPGEHCGLRLGSGGPQAARRPGIQATAPGTPGLTLNPMPPFLQHRQASMRAMTVRRPDRDTATTAREDGQESSPSGAPSAREGASGGLCGRPPAPTPPAPIPPPPPGPHSPGPRSPSPHSPQPPAPPLSHRPPQPPIPLDVLRGQPRPCPRLPSPQLMVWSQHPTPAPGPPTRTHRAGAGA